jgi:serine protease Do
MKRIGVCASVLAVGAMVYAAEGDAPKPAESKTPKDSEKAAEPKGLPKFLLDNSPLPPGTPTYAPVIEKVSPSVVTVKTKKMMVPGAPTEGGGRHPMMDDPLLRRFFGLPEVEDGQGGKKDGEKERKRGGKQGKPVPQDFGLGSGVIVSEEGHILTNNHVVDGADEIEGADPETDIAVLKIEGRGFKAVTFGDSDKLRSGDIVLAVGNPFELTQSATMGVVSATGRHKMQIASFGNFIQTDAAINMGNSGGALVDYLGRLVGINTAIFSRSGGNQGIGFAVPSNVARFVMESLLRSGKVSRGFLGIMPQEITPELARTFKVEEGVGVLVAQVTPGSAAEKAGMKKGDVLLEAEGQRVDTPDDFRFKVASMPPGAKVRFKVTRDGKPLEVTATLAERPDLAKAAPAPVVEPDPDVLDGVEVADLDESNRKEFRIPEGIEGVLITKVEPESPSGVAGIRKGDVIQEIGRKPVKTADEAVKMSEDLKREREVLVLVSSRGSNRYVLLKQQ